LKGPDATGTINVVSGPVANPHSTSGSAGLGRGVSRALTWLVVAVLVLLGTPVAGQPVPPSTREAARALANEGAQLFDKGDFLGAYDKLSQAEKLMPVPTLALEVARCLERLGRLVAASEQYTVIAAMPIRDDLKPAQKEVQQEAKLTASAELAALNQRLPRLLLSVEGPNPQTLHIDGKALPLTQIGVPLPVDPGNHHLVASRPAATWSQTVTAIEHQTLAVVVRLTAASSPPPAPSPSAPPGTGPPPPPTTPTPDSTLVPIGWVLVGLGGASLVVSLGTYVAAVDKEGELAELCPDGTCRRSQVGPEIEDEIASYDALSTAATVTLVAGGVLAAAGTALLIAAPDGDTASGTALQPYVGPGFGGILGRF